MPAVIYADVGGDKNRLLARLKKLGEIKTAHATEEIAEQLRTSAVERFSTTKAPAGKTWKTSIRAQESGGKTLTKTARLKTSIHATSDRSGLAVGTNTIYAATHQFGARRVIKPKKARVLRFKIGDRWYAAKQVRIRIPARPFLGVSEEDKEYIMDTVDKYLSE